MRRVSTFDSRVHKMIGNAVAFDILVDLVLVVAVVTERVEDLRELQVR